MTTATHIPADVQLEVSKAVEQIDFVNRTYQLNVWSSNASKETWKHDLGVMRMHRNLRFIRLDLIGHDRLIVFQMEINFGKGAPTYPLGENSARGVEMPVLPRDQVASGRVVVRQGRDMDAYQNLLQLKWKNAPGLQQRSSDSYESEHARHITGGRLSGQFNVANDARHRLRICQGGDRGFAFAESLDETQFDSVFCHDKFVTDGTPLVVGSVVRGFIVQTPRGLQARSITSA